MLSHTSLSLLTTKIGNNPTANKKILDCGSIIFCIDELALRLKYYIYAFSHVHLCLHTLPNRGMQT